jgi:ribulose-phosphate 3-epimerase
MEKVATLREMSKYVNPELLIEIDGGVNAKNAPELVRSGANMLVAGSFVFRSDDPISTIKSLKSH